MSSDFLSAGAQERKDKLSSDLHNMASGAGEMARTAADSSAEALSIARDKFSDTVSQAKDQAAEFSAVARDRARIAADKAGDYVRAHPWQSVGAVAVGGLLLGLLLNRRH